MNGLKSVNIELTSRCNKSCAMCGRRKQEKEYPELCDWGDMPWEMVKNLRQQIPKGVFIQWHNNGEPLLYKYLGGALELFKGYYMGLDTNGKLLWEKRHDVMGLSSITISVIPDDPEGTEQLQIAKKFAEIKHRPAMVFRMLGNIDRFRVESIKQLVKKYDKIETVKRILHKPEGSFGYEKEVVKPEHGICEEMLHKLAIDRYGNVYPCVRFDPHKLNLLGNVNDCSLSEIWESLKRREWIQHHINFQRGKVPLCDTCDFYGIPRG